MSDLVASFDDPSVDDRIDLMVRKANTVNELVMNAEFLMAEYVADFLKLSPSVYEMACEVAMTAEQRCRLAIRYTGVREDVDDLGPTFLFMLRVCQIRTNLGRQNEQQLLRELCTSYMRILRPDDHEEDVFPPDRFPFIRYAVAGHLVYAYNFLSETAVEMKDEEADGPV